MRGKEGRGGGHVRCDGHLGLGKGEIWVGGRELRKGVLMMEAMRSEATRARMLLSLSAASPAALLHGWSGGSALKGVGGRARARGEKTAVCTEPCLGFARFSRSAEGRGATCRTTFFKRRGRKGSRQVALIRTREIKKWMENICVRGGIWGVIVGMEVGGVGVGVTLFRLVRFFLRTYKTRRT